VLTPPVLAITVGDPGGIGPEVVRAALADSEVRSLARFRVLAPASCIRGLSGDVEVVDYGSGDFPASHGRAGGEVSYRMVEDAIAMAKRPVGDPVRVDAIVTGPISKLAWKLAGHGEFPGHTELFAARFGGEGGAGMMFVTPRLKVILATTHIPLSRVAEALTVDGVLRAIRLGHGACVRLGVARPRIAVCGVNPHAGEGGVLGMDEERAIIPAIAAAVEGGMDASGPHPGDTVFNAAVAGRYDLVVAMYHDQGLIPVKLLDRDRAVNVTVGLPVVRTSLDHGTAFDIAGKGVADAGSMIAAIRLAARMCGASSAPRSA
jgi:4-phospho-D-threonate 3-dehydrogenase / 4-phospho-D-erythronate 3-dehydrogenase